MSRPAVWALAVAMLGACRPDTVTLIPDSELPGDVFGSPSPGQAEELPERGTVYFLRSRHLAPVSRSLPPEGSLPEAMLEALLTDPPSRYNTAIPTDTRLISVGVSDGVAVVDLSDEFERSAPGRVLALRVAQVVYTVTEAPGVFAVRFSIEGVPKGVVAGEDRVVQRPVTRADYEGFVLPDEEDAGAAEDPDDG